MAATNHAKDMKKDTKEFIMTAALQILTKENLSGLNVSELCKRAGVSRMAFYRNFSTLEQVLYEYYQPKISAVFEAIQQERQDCIKYELQLNFFNNFGDILLLSFERGFEPVIQKIFTEEMEKFYALGGDEYRTAFMSAGTYALWRKWLLDGRQKPLREIMGLLKKFDVSIGTAQL